MGYDVAIIGGGHNGLTCAAYLARAGKKVIVLEERDIVGGFCTSEETIPEAPGYRSSPASLDILTGNIPPSVIEELGLKDYGLELVSPDPFYSYLHPNGRSFSFWRDYKRTCEEIAVFSQKDAEAYAELTEIMRDVWYTAAPYLMDHPTRPRLKTILTLVRRVLGRRKNLLKAVRMLLSAPEPLINELFESDEVRAALANLAAGGLRELHEPMSGLIMSVMALQHEWGVRRPVGGQSGLVEALANFVRAHGGEVRCNARVERVLTDGAKATGVLIGEGEEILASHVVGAVDPVTLFSKLMPSSLLPEKTRRELESLSVFGNNVSAFRADIALSRRLKLAVDGDTSQKLTSSTILLSPDVPFVVRSVRKSVLGEVTPDMPLWVAIPSVLDRTLVPEGSKGDGIYVYVPTVPLKLRDGQDWSDVKDQVLEDIITILEQYAPDIRETIVGAVARSPDDFRKFSNVHEGHMFHSDMSMAQMGPWRPTPSLAGYASPVPGLWHTAAGAHPMGTICGWSGRTAARTILRKGF